MADFTPARETQPPSAEQQNQEVPPTIPAFDTQLPPPAAAIPSQSPAAAPSPGKRPRGRPRGSKNKAKPPVYIAEENVTMGHAQLLIPPGCDLVAMLENYARQHQVGIHIESGIGTVANISLRDTGVAVAGVFDLVTLSGTYLDPSMYSGSIEGAFPSYIPGGVVPWMKMILSGNTWQITRALVVSQALAVSDVLVNVITFRSFLVQRVEPAMFAFQEQAYPPPTAAVMPGLMIGGGGGISGDVQMGGEMPTAGYGLPGGEMAAPGYGLPGGGQLSNYMPSAGVGFRPPNYYPSDR